MAIQLEVDPRNADFANRIEKVVKDEWGVSDEAIATSIATLDSLISPEAALLEYQARRRTYLPYKVNPYLNKLNPTLDAAYHPIVRRDAESSFKDLPEEFELPAFGLVTMEALGEEDVVKVPTHHGMLPNVALTPDGFLVRFRPLYFFNRRGEGLMYTDLLFTNPLDLPPHRPFSETPYTADLQRARRIPLTPDLHKVGPRRLTEEDFKFVETVITNVEHQLT